MKKGWNKFHLKNNSLERKTQGHRTTDSGAVSLLFRRNQSNDHSIADCITNHHVYVVFLFGFVQGGGSRKAEGIRARFLRFDCDIFSVDDDVMSKKKPEKLTEMDIRELMGEYRDVYKRAKGGALRSK
ncbi:hypothetical protein [Salicibibacter kimchii]|uniref:hypothetical protein n=1 Tax=Salicibibacter kimchii TaxID=2099786 RepID=UPI00135C4B5B|nr:hypothetical protein [Salicibibacter kimchii]